MQVISGVDPPDACVARVVGPNDDVQDVSHGVRRERLTQCGPKGDAFRILITAVSLLGLAVAWEEFRTAQPLQPPMQAFRGGCLWGVTGSRRWPEGFCVWHVRREIGLDI